MRVYSRVGGLQSLRKAYTKVQIVAPAAGMMHSRYNVALLSGAVLQTTPENGRREAIRGTNESINGSSNTDTRQRQLTKNVFKNSDQTLLYRTSKTVTITQTK